MMMYLLVFIFTVWLVALLILAGLYFLLRNWPSTAWIATLCLVGTGTSYIVADTPSETWAKHSAILIFGFSVFVTTMPVGVLFFLSYLATRVKNFTLRCMVILLGTAIAVIVWLYLSLLMACTLGTCL